MVKRLEWRRYAFLAFAMILLILSWETNLTNAAVVQPEIPEQSIRLRILANSDDVQDQAVKRRVRDAIIQEMNSWVASPMSIEEAREVVRSKLPEINKVVDGVLKDNGFDYGYNAELGIVPFPTKMYGSKVYPAGDYEALRVTLGKGEGQNWWCVLFPPLCFVDIVTGEKTADGKPTAQQAGADVTSAVVKEQAAKAAKVEKAGNAQAPVSLSDANDKPQQAELRIESKSQVKFFFWEKLKALFA